MDSLAAASSAMGIFLAGWCWICRSGEVSEFEVEGGDGLLVGEVFHVVEEAAADGELAAGKGDGGLAMAAVGSGVRVQIVRECRVGNWKNLPSIFSPYRHMLAHRRVSGDRARAFLDWGVQGGKSESVKVEILKAEPLKSKEKRAEAGGGRGRAGAGG
jgi:hypothetical protein